MSIDKKYFQAHSSHLVAPSPWPILTAFALFYTAIGATAYFHGHGAMTLNIGLLATIFGMQLWLRDVVIEGSYQGHHLPRVAYGFMLGFVLFIVSEVFAFISIFWAYAHSALAPSVELGSTWPPTGITAIDPFGLPLLNTILLLSSGAVLTVAHHGLVQNSRVIAVRGLIATILLAILFTACQVFEYYSAPFGITDSAYGSTFFGSTGLHGFHIFVGTIFLVVGLLRIINYNSTSQHSVGLEAGILYWHFVDVVWIALFAVMYYWAAQ
jgi:cytochrome c oxidase subunit 3